MEFEGLLFKILEPVRGTSTRGEWVKQEAVFELPGEFNRKVCVSFWGDKVQDLTAFHPGDKVAVMANVESREYNNRWFTEVRAWKIRAAVGGAAGAKGAQGSAETAPAAYSGGANPKSGSMSSQNGASSEEFDDLPF